MQRERTLHEVVVLRDPPAPPADTAFERMASSSAGAMPWLSACMNLRLPVQHQKQRERRHEDLQVLRERA